MPNEDIEKLREEALSEHIPGYLFMIDIIPPKKCVKEFEDIVSNKMGSSIGLTGYSYTSAILTSHITRVQYWWPSKLNIDFLNTPRTLTLVELMTKNIMNIEYSILDRIGEIVQTVRYKDCVLDNLNKSSRHEPEYRMDNYIKTVFDVTGGYDIL